MIDSCKHCKQNNGTVCPDFQFSYELYCEFIDYYIAVGGYRVILYQYELFTFGDW